MMPLSRLGRKCVNVSVETSLPAQLIEHWRRVRFEHLTAELQFDELQRVTRYPKFRERLTIRC